MLPSRDIEYIEKEIGRSLSDLEMACFENLWSEHCSYRSTKPLLRTLPTSGENVLLGPGDDAAIVRFSDEIAIAIGMESHNHPSYVDPYDGAATGVGGIVRDIISMGARPIALMDPLYFGDLSGEKNRYLFEHVVSGIGDYGNCIGVPVVRGELTFDENYSGNPLVNVVCVGVVDPETYLTARVKKPKSRLILYGSSTGRDGLGGASFASRDLSEDSESEDRPAVQVGDPYTEKLLIEATLEMAETGKVLSCRDLGAAGLAGASSEMSSTYGARIAADKVHLRESNMNEVEILLAESQERMLMEVLSEDVEELTRIIEKYDLKWSDIGEVTEEKRYVVTFHGQVVCDLPIDLLVEGAPEEAWEGTPYSVETPFIKPSENIKTLAEKVLSHPDIADKSWVKRQYDHDVQLRTVSTQGGCGVLRLGDSALYLSCGCSPRQIRLKPYEGTANVVYENAANLAAMGAEPLCIVNCLNFASPVHKEIFWQISESVRGMGDMCRKLNIPVVGGNVSLYNESDEFGTQILPTPSIGMAGKGDVRAFNAAKPGMILAVIGGSAKPEFGGSMLDLLTGCGGSAPLVPDVCVLDVMRNLVRNGNVWSATDISHGGLVAALAGLTESCEVTIKGDALTELFSESYGRFLVAVSDEKSLAGVSYTVIGKCGGDGILIHTESGDLAITGTELKELLSSTTKLMRY
ncbi:phosphoribosylformylglycinamidine synthase subunit PurL [Methanoplanus sp. FWC-SCC4]|uniref:Phosphoribosylformylglycinamidine synthase subunit PurL n=1 Tax=Methanochimaera problematica TaxID=2609417 RepID=A0AA97FCT5_9EURY|nr:phosphoribosylformylglycinamidine synthase subunit PurL [Methanoplanus sp. FWC-SCC4]WOF16687.1 phosphoribosylformylglycinamidine synthase subunit PurL [Methanoplanus sp. FWC-SCC4]